MMRIIVFIGFILCCFQAWCIDFVSIVDIRNPKASNGKGSVDYIYQISKNEITNREYVIFLNNVAKKDPYHLFSPLMQNHFFGGIQRNGVEGSYEYLCKSGYENRPVIGITWMSCIRYINWLHYNALNIEKRVAINQFYPYTEGDEQCGAYNTYVIPTKRNAGALYWLPNADEWLKAAYFDGKQWHEDLLIKGSNCYGIKGWSYPYPHIKNVGYGVQPSHYGTFDQQGNAAEWIEDTREHDGWKISLGGSLIRPASFAAFTESEADDPNKSITTFGFRVCRKDGPIIATPKLYKSEIVHENKKRLELCKDKLGNEYVRVHHAGNRGDVVNQYKGRVNYEYLIAKTELNNYSYCQFLNAVACISDPYGLYDENMQTGACGGIVRNKVRNRYEYRCKEGWEKRPVVYVNYYDICRFANWMHYGCPQSGECKLGTTEGTSSMGAYDTSDFEEVRKGNKAPYKSFGKRNVGALYWIPSDDEWYKAAYYDPERIDNRKYHNYPTRTSDAPDLKQCNYMVDNQFSVGAPFYIAPVDSFGDAPSYFGTLQQGGNVWEWIEDWQYGQIGSRGLRGGSWSYTAYGLNACNTDPGGIDNCGYVFGARLCKSTDDRGWQEVKTPILEQIYEFIMLLPLSRILIYTGLFVVLFFSVICLVLYIIISKLKSSRKK